MPHLPTGRERIMKRIAIVGVGPTGIYTFYELVKRGEPLAITLF